MNRHWAFTENNPRGLIDWTLHPQVIFAVYQEELGEDGTDHLQGHVQLARSQRLSFLKTILPRAHWKPARNIEASIRYSQKAETRIDGPYLYGEYRPQGKTPALLDIKRAIDAGADISSLARDDAHFATWVRHSRALEKYQLMLTPRQTRYDLEVALFYGPPGTGKTEAAHSIDNIFPHTQTKWFDGYEPGRPLLIDDFNGYIPYAEFVTLIDRYPIAKEYKGGYLAINPKLIIITSNFRIETWWKDNNVLIEAVTRRINKFFYFSKGREPLECKNYDDLMNKF